MAVTTIKPGGAGPLTTVFTTPDFCASSAWSNYETPALSSSICMPNGWTEYWNYRAGFYSPAICPFGYTRACTIPEDLATGISLGGPLTSGETGHICCPTGGYTCFPGDPWTEPWPYSKCRSTGTSVYTASNEITPAFVTTTSPLVYAIQVRWRDADLSSLATNPTVYGETITAPSTATASAGSRTTATASSTAAANDDDDDDDDDDNADDFDDLPTGAKIGIVVGATGAAVLLALGAYLLWRRRQSSRTRHQQAVPPSAGAGAKPGSPYTQLSEESLAAAANARAGDIALGTSPVSPLTPAMQQPQSACAAEAPGSVAYAAEMPGCQMHPVEMPADAGVAELPGDEVFVREGKREGAS